MDEIVCENLLPGRARRSCRLSAGLVRAVALALMTASPILAAEPAAPRSNQKQAGQTRSGSGRPPANRSVAARPDERTVVRSPKIDPAVMQAGGTASGHAKCSQCQRSACPQCRLAEGHKHAHSHCQHGLCPAHCPVRPDVFGFYGTQWRRWPGSGVVQAANNEAATPVRPPRAEIPGAEEESFAPDGAAENLPGPAAAELPHEPEDTKLAGMPPAVVDPQPRVGRRATDDEAAASDAAEGDLPQGGPAGETPEETASEEAAVLEDGGHADEVEEEVSQTAWRTFTTSPPRRLAARP